MDTDESVVLKQAAPLLLLAKAEREFNTDLRVIRDNQTTDDLGSKTACWRCNRSRGTGLGQAG